MPISVMLADDHSVVRQGVRALLGTDASLNVVAEATTGPETLQMVHLYKPDVLVLDLAMPGAEPMDVTGAVHAESPETRIVVLSMHRNQAYVQAALKGGAMGYVLKQSPAAEILEAIHAAAQGKLFLSSPLTEKDIEAYTQALRSERLDPYDTLTSRERQVLKAVAEGRSNKQIALTLGIRPRTVETHRANLMSKLGLRSSGELIRYAYQRGLVALEYLADDRSLRQ